MASLGQLVAGVAHQVNAPLAYASSNVGVVKSKLSALVPVYETVRKLGDAVLNKKYDSNTFRSLLSQQVSAYSKAKTVIPDDLVSLLNDSSEGLSDIQETVESLTNYSHVDSALFEDIRIDKVIKKALKMCKDNFNERKITCELSNHPQMVSGVSNQLTQVLINVINNALDATDDADGIVAIKALTMDGFIKITVTDNGHGINESILGQVLDPFFTTKDVGEGTGLGLSICNQIISAHNGEISIDSDLSVGTAISIKLPLAEIDQDIVSSPNEGTDSFDTSDNLMHAS